MVLYAAGYLCHVDFGMPMPDVNADLLVRADKPAKNKRKSKHQVRWQRRRGQKDAGGKKAPVAVQVLSLIHI